MCISRNESKTIMGLNRVSRCKSLHRGSQLVTRMVALTLQTLRELPANSRRHSVSPTLLWESSSQHICLKLSGCLISKLVIHKGLNLFLRNKKIAIERLYIILLHSFNVETLTGYKKLSFSEMTYCSTITLVSMGFGVTLRALNACLFYKKQTLWLQPGCFLKFREIQPSMFL